MFSSAIDARALVAKCTTLERVHLPRALLLGLNDAAFDVRQGWREAIPQVFDRPTLLTQNAVLVRKATPSDLSADVFLRNEASGGTPPARYLLAEVTGGRRLPKPFERRLRAAGVLGPDEYVVPAANVPLDAFGNLPAGIVKQILSDLRASSDPAATSTAKSRRRRDRSRTQAFGSFFEAAPALSASQGRRQPLPRGIYQRATSRFVGPRKGSVRMVLAIVKRAEYRVRFNPRAITEPIFYARFPVRFRSALTALIARAQSAGP